MLNNDDVEHEHCNGWTDPGETAFTLTVVEAHKHCNGRTGPGVTAEP